MCPLHKISGDGNPSAFGSVVASNLNKDVYVSKLECVGHIRKRMGCANWKLKASYGNRKLSSGKTIKGANRLTDNLFDKFKDFYEKAIRNNSDDHRYSTDDKP